MINIFRVFAYVDAEYFYHFGLWLGF